MFSWTQKLKDGQHDKTDFSQLIVYNDHYKNAKRHNKTRTELE